MKLGLWGKPPGGLDALNTSSNFHMPSFSGRPFGIPEMLVDSINLDAMKELPFIRYNARKTAQDESVCHFFIRDYLFEYAWNHPWMALKSIKRFSYLISPDFSVYPEWPDALNIFNVYRSRWLGRFWQENGITVIPSVTWSTQSSYAYAFAGLPLNASVAIAPLQLDDKEVYLLFKHGFKEMVRSLTPRQIIWYGTDAHVDEFWDFARKWVGAEVLVIPPTRFVADAEEVGVD